MRGSAFRRSPRTAIPVSYTHLDVYKRQTLYCTHQPCGICAKMIVNAGIRRVVYQEGYPDEFSRQMLQEGGVSLEKYPRDASAPGRNGE